MTVVGDGIAVYCDCFLVAASGDSVYCSDRVISLALLKQTVKGQGYES